MASLCICCSLFEYLLIILMISFAKSFSVNDNQHQLLKVNLGQDVTMSCYFDQNNIEQVSFMRSMTGDLLSLGSELIVQENPSNEHIKLIQFSKNRLDLKLISVNQNDSGIYSCMVNDQELSSFALEIFVPPRFISYSPLESSLSYNEGSSMNFSCHAYAIPSVNITWIYRDYNKQAKTIHIGEDLYISSIESSDSGSYECIATNGYHSSISRSFYVTVQYSPRVILLNDQNVNVDIDDTVIIKCQICSKPEIIHVDWLRDNRIVQDVNIIIKTETIDNQQCSVSIMEIVGISEYQFDRYECRAQNNLGEKSSFVNIKSTKNSKILKRKENEINLNTRIALLIDKQYSINSTLLTTNYSSKLNYSLLLVFINNFFIYLIN